jgi:hypothetical protein
LSIFKLLRSLFPRTRLAGIRGPESVSVHGSVATPNEITSPLSGIRAALFSWRFFVRWSNDNRVLGDRDVFARSGERHDLLFSCVHGGDLVISTKDGDVLVPRERLSIRVSGIARAGIPIEGPLPPEAAHVLAMPDAKRGVLVYQELPLGSGDAVRLRARVEAVSYGGGAYRNGGDVVAPYRARPDLQPSIVEDESV